MDGDIRKQLDRLTVPIEVAGRALGIGRSSAYAAARNGSIPAIRIGGKIVVPTAPLRRMLGLLDAA